MRGSSLFSRSHLTSKQISFSAERVKSERKGIGTFRFPTFSKPTCAALPEVFKGIEKELIIVSVAVLKHLRGIEETKFTSNKICFSNFDQIAFFIRVRSGKKPFQRFFLLNFCNS